MSIDNDVLAYNVMGMVSWQHRQVDANAGHCGVVVLVQATAHVLILLNHIATINSRHYGVLLGNQSHSAAR